MTRIKGAKTSIQCWKVEVKAGDVILHNQKYTTLGEVSKGLGLSYNVIVEIANNRRKQRSGKYDTIYKIKRLADCNEGIEGLGNF